MNILNKLRPTSLRSKSSVAIIVTVAVLIELISTGQYLFSRKGIREEVEHRAETELRIKNLEIQKVMVAVETAVNNSVWAVERLLQQPDSLYTAIRRLVAQNPTIVGGGMMFVADYYPQKGRWFEPYVARRDDGTCEKAQIGSAAHDYLQAEFYVNGMNAGQGYWSEPYYDDAGAKMMLCTYTLPVHDSEGRTVALLGADVSLDWLSSTINANHIYPSSYNVVISRTGQLLVCPEESLVMRRSIQEITATAHDTTAAYINRQMMSGQSGRSELTDNQGQKNYVFYTPVGGNTGWSMAVVCSDQEIYSGLRRVGLYMLLFLLAGLALLGYIIYRTARSARSLEKANAEKERIGSELHIARSIQESMIPKIFPPYPERDDVDIFASLVPAKEVGGDLYDFYIRDEKLFFCIGDVSGKGVPASLVMAVTRSLFRTVSAHEERPVAIVTAMNKSMADMNESNMFVTLFVGVLDLATGQLRYCNAGHDAPLLIGRGIGLLPVENNIPVGLMPDWEYKEQEALIYPLTTIFLYTDGLTEAEDSTRAQFGKQRMLEVARQLLRSNRPNTSDKQPDTSDKQPDTSDSRTVTSDDACGTCNPEDLIRQLTDAVHQFVGDAEQSDDLTMLAIRSDSRGRCR